MLAGIDLSNNNPTADFYALRNAGYLFAIHKASEGVGFVDRYLAPRWPQMQAAGMGRGAYHFCRPSASSAQAEADFFVRIVRPLLETGDSVWADIEDERFPVGANVSPWALEFCDRVAQAVGFAPGIYTYPSYIPERHLNHPDLAQYPLWWASYSQPMRPAPRPWDEAALWQYTSEGHPPGTTGNIDLNWLLADDLAAFTRLGKGGGVQWTGTVSGRSHWGADPLMIERRGDRLYRRADDFDLTGLALDDWETVTGQDGQLVIDD